MDGKIKRIFKDIIIGLIIMWALSPIALIVPVLYLLVPSVMGTIAIRNDKNTGLLALLIMALSVGYTSSPQNGLGMFLVYLPSVIAIKYLYSTIIKLKFDFSKRVGLLALAFIIGLGLMFGADYIATGTSPKEMVIESVNLIQDGNLEAFRNSELSQYQIRDLERAIRSASKSVLAMFPGIILMTGFLSGLLNALFMENMTYRFKKSRSRNYLYQFKLPDSFPLGVAMAFIAGIIMRRMGISYSQAFLQNIILIVGFLSLTQGMAVLSYYLRKRGIRGFFRGLIYVLAIVLPGFNFIIMGVGLLDSSLDLRKMRKNRS